MDRPERAFPDPAPASRLGGLEFTRGRFGGAMASPIRVLVVAILFVPAVAFAQPPTLHPGDRYRFLGASPDVTKGSGCDGTVNGCDVEYGDLGADKPRVYALT